MKPTLLILAAGLGSRYGGVKQMDKIGPSGESIIDYSIFDAIRSGFGKVVFILNPKIKNDFLEIYEPRLRDKIDYDYVLQEITDIPDGVLINPDRIKPWGTGHAVLVAQKKINEPFAVINADDFYGEHAFKLLSSFMKDIDIRSSNYAMVGYKLMNTLSENGSVSRGICQTKNNLLSDVVERTSISYDHDDIVYLDNGVKTKLDPNALVSMNFWGFTPNFFNQLDRDFTNFIEAHSNELKSEFYIPTVVNNLIKSGEATIKMLTSEDQWFGVTYKEDKETTISSINKLIKAGHYPEKLW